MRALMTPATLFGSVSAPPSKSMAHRLLISAALANGKSVIHNLADSADITATIACLRALGARIERQGEDAVVYGTDVRARSATVALPCNESGSTLRFLIPLALLGKAEACFSGTEKLLSRPLDIYETICTGQGFTFCRTPSTVTVGGRLAGGDYRVVGNISSQFISGLLFALPLCEGDSRILITPPLESRPYIDLTLQALAAFGIRAFWADERTLAIPGGQAYRPAECTVEGDYSGAAFFAALNLLGSRVEVTGLRPDSLQGDKAYLRYYGMLEKGTPTIHLGNCPDLGPVLMAVAAAKNGAVFCGTRRLRIKESDRGAAMAEELAKFGTAVEVLEDSIVVYPQAFHAPDEPLHGHNDHRIVMALCTLLNLTGGEIDDAEAVRKSMPDYFEKMCALGAKVTLHEA